MPDLSGTLHQIERRLWLIALATAGGLLIVAATVSALSYRITDRLVRPWMDRSMALSIAAREELVRHFIQTSQEVARQVALQEPARSMLERHGRGTVDREAAVAASAPALAEAGEHWSALRALVRLDARGEAVVTLGVPPDDPRAGWSDGPAWSPMIAGGLPVMRVATAIASPGQQRIGTDLAFFSLHPLSMPFQSNLSFHGGLRKRLAAIIDGRPAWLIPAGALMEDADARAIRTALAGRRRGLTRLIVSDGRWQHEYSAMPEGLVIAIRIDRADFGADVRRAMLANAGLIGALIVVGILSVLLLVRPLAKRVAAQATALAASERRLSLAQGAARIATFEYDIDEDRIIATSGLESLYGLPTERLPRQVAHWATLVHPEDRTAALAHLRASIERGEAYASQFRVVHPDGSVHWIEAKGQVREEAGGRRLLGVNVDIDERKAAEQEVLRVNRDLEQFASVASHDLQEPLRMVASYLSLLERRHGADLAPAAQGYLAQALEGARRMQGLIRDLLAFARAARGLPASPVSAADACADAVRDLQELIAGEGATVDVEPLPVVMAERGTLARLFQNLIANALKYHRPGVPPAIRVSALRLDPHTWRFAVSDNGVGIPEEQRQRVFDTFQRLHARAEVSGTGLGLAICKRIVEGFGGSIWVESTVGEGSTFYFTLPAVPRG